MNINNVTLLELTLVVVISLTYMILLIMMYNKTRGIKE
jgi:hypothetical protein